MRLVGRYSLSWQHYRTARNVRLGRRRRRGEVAGWHSLMKGVPVYQLQASPGALEQGQDRRPEGTAKLREIWAIRARLQLRSNLRDLALFNLANDSKLRACDLLGLRVDDIAHENHVNSRAVVMQRKTRRPVQFEITEMSRDALQAWTRTAGLRSSDYVFPSRSVNSPHLSARQYARIVHRWVREIGLDSSCYGTHTARRTTAALIYGPIKNLRAVQLLLGHTKLESTVRYLGIEVDDALEIAEQTEAFCFRPEADTVE